MTELEALKAAKEIGYFTVAMIDEEGNPIDYRNIDDVIKDVSDDLLNENLDHMDEYYFCIVEDVIIRKLDYYIDSLYALFFEEDDDDEEYNDRDPEMDYEYDNMGAHDD